MAGMTITVPTDEDPAHLPPLPKWAQAGETDVPAQVGTACARRFPRVDASAPRQSGRLTGRIDTTQFFDPLSDGELDTWDGR
jgi:hypothetical protein